MKQTWTTDPEIIQKELKKIIADKISIIFVYQQTKRKKLYAKGTVQINTGSLLVLHFPEEFTDFDKTCTCYYHFPGAPLRGFACQPIKQADDFLGIGFPNEIYELQRRKHPRVPTPQNSTGTFLVKNRSRVLSCHPQDISREGARLSGDFSTVILKNDILTPVTLNLTQRFKLQNETVIHIHEAIVTWAQGNDDKTKMIGINFTITDDDLTALDNYIDLRIIEDTPAT